MPSIEEVIRSLAERDEGEVSGPDLVAALVEREEAIADQLRLAGAQFGLYPEIVAEVLAQVGFGAPITPEQRQLIHDQFVNLMNTLQEQYRQQRGDNG
jgi:hypothetical protein